MSKKIIILFLVVVGVGAAFFLLERQAFEDPNSVKISGNIEITEVELSFKIPGKVISRLVSEGEQVTAGQTVASLETNELQHEVALHEAELEAAKAKLLELQKGYLPEEIKQGEAKLHRATAKYDRLSADYNRQKTLFEGDVISSREFDASTSAFEVAKAEMQEASENLSLLKKGPREEKIALAKANVAKSREALALARSRLDDAQLQAPISGFVLSENIEAGEYASRGTPIVTIGNLKDVWLRGYVDESDLGKIKLGQQVKVTIDSFPDKSYEGKISFISQEAEFTPKNVQTEKERVKLVYRVKVNIHNPNFELKPGMPADAFINVTS